MSRAMHCFLYFGGYCWYPVQVLFSLSWAIRLSAIEDVSDSQLDTSPEIYSKIRSCFTQISLESYTPTP